MKLGLVFLVAAGLAACKAPPAQEPESVEIVSENPATSAARCPAACANLRKLGCPEGSAKPGEDSCEDVCRRGQAAYPAIDFRPACIASRSTKASLRTCGTYRCL